MFKLKHLLLAITFIVTLASCQPTNAGRPLPPDTRATRLQQVILPPGTPNEEINYYGFKVGFNPQLHIPNYVCWELLDTETDGPIERQRQFSSDPAVSSCPTTDDYRNSGFDRGHMCPAGDMKWDRRAMQDCFLLTNICPQNKKLNSGSWKKLEEKCRRWAQRDSALIIISGPITTDRLTRTIGQNKVAVPERFFKIVFAPYAHPPRAIAFIMPNAQVPGGMQAAVCTVDRVEAETGMDFFATLPDDIENSIESQASFPLWERCISR